MTIRLATEADWPRIWPFFDEIVRAGETYAFPLDLTIETAKPWWMSPETVVLEQDGVVLGSAKMGPNRPGPGAHVGTGSFMVNPAAQGRGVGRRLATYVIEWHREHGFAGIQFNAVVETNTRRRTPLAGPWLRDHRHRPRSLRERVVRQGRSARDVPRPAGARTGLTLRTSVKS